jgi:hypothetical protein
MIIMIGTIEGLIIVIIIFGSLFFTISLFHFLRKLRDYYKYKNENTNTENSNNEAFLL